MTEGGIAGWKKKEGETFTTGDVLLEIVRISPLIVNQEARAREIYQRPWKFKRQTRSSASIRNQKGAMIRKDAEETELMNRKRIKQQ